ncbi:ParA family protein [Lentzea sp. E54]|uniref:ParA family protein n=1 Tax=Lentzea xerophila TaxID=3435883 RepID=UPI003DA48FAE
MHSYAFWNNKGGVGKSFLCFTAACQLAHDNPESDIYVIDLCPQANVSETLLGGFTPTDPPIQELAQERPRRTVAGYLEARLSNPFGTVSAAEVEKYISIPNEFNSKIPKNVNLVAGDNLLEILSEAIRQTSALPIPSDAWKRVLEWVRDLCKALSARSADRDAYVLIDCNPSFAVYTQQALVAADNIIIPFTADDSSRRGIENVFALLYGVGQGDIAEYAKINFARRAEAERVETPKLHTFVSNRVTLYGETASKAFEIAAKIIKSTVEKTYKEHPSLFQVGIGKLDKTFTEVPDYHSACIISTITGTPIHLLKPGPKTINGERVQINIAPLNRYKEALANFTSRL